MKIAVISTSAIESPPQDQGYAGIEVVVWNFARAASAMGHEVTLITTFDSPNLGNFDVLKEGTDEKLGRLSVVGAGPTGWNVSDEKTMYNAYREWLEREFGQGQGVVWDNSWWGYPYLSARKFPQMKIIHSHHGESNWAVGTPQGPRFIKPPVAFPRMCAVSSIHAQHLSNKFGVPFKYVHNGIDLPEYDPAGAVSENFLLSLNRITPEKGIHNNIEVALRTGFAMKIVGDDIHPPNQNYIDDIQNRCAMSGGQIQYYGRVDNETKWDLLRRCKGLISCTDNGNWIEAFGLYVVEANSVGKPVIATANGGLYDTIQNGVNGTIHANTEGVIASVQSGILDAIKPEDCRARAEQFTTRNMVENYLTLFEKVLNNEPDSKW